MQNSFLELNDDYLNDEKEKHIYDDVEIIIDPELEDESTIDINNYVNKFILQCRICGNLFPSEELLDDDSECPICDSKSPNGFIFKGKLKHKDNKETSSEKEKAINDLLNNEESDNNESFNDLSDNLSDNNIPIEQ